MVLQTKPYTVEDFDVFVGLPGNADRLWEFIGGEIVEVPSNPYASMIAALFLIEFGIFLKGKDLGFLTGEAGDYMVSGERYAPDVAFISKAKGAQLAKQGYNPNPPDLVVEVDFPSDTEALRKLRIKIANYLAAGTTVWVVHPQTKEVESYAPGKPVRVIGVDGTLDGGEILPGFKLAVKAIFPAEPGEQGENG